MNYALVRKLLPCALRAAVLIAGAAWLYERGYQAAARHYEAQISADKLARAQALERLQAAAREKETENARKLASALEERDKALARADSLRRDSVRLRDRADSAAASLRAGSASPDPDGSKLARCRELLAEGANLVGAGGELAAEGAGLLTRVAADHDALSTQVQ